MECSKTCALIFTALVLSTAGFVLTITAWFAPPLNRFVDHVRLAGPVILLLGFCLMILSCILCSFVQGRCCACCYTFSSRKQMLFTDDDESYNPTIQQRVAQIRPPIVTTQPAPANVNNGERTSSKKTPQRNGRLPYLQSDLANTTLQQSSIISPYPSIYPAPTSCHASPRGIHVTHDMAPTGTEALSIPDQSVVQKTVAHEPTARHSIVGVTRLESTSIGVDCKMPTAKDKTNPEHTPGVSEHPDHALDPGERTGLVTSDDVWIPKQSYPQKHHDAHKPVSQQKVHPVPDCVPCREISFMANTDGKDGTCQHKVYNVSV